MTTTDAARLLSVLVDGNRSDLAVPAELRIAELVELAGLRADDPGLTISAAGGRRLDAAATVGEVLLSGETVVIGTDNALARSLADRSPVRSPSDGSDRGRPAVLALAIAGMASIVQLGTAIALDGHPGGGPGANVRLVAGLIGLLAAVLVAISSARRRLPELSDTVAGLTAFAAGYGLVAGTMAGHAELAVTTGGLACGAVSALGRSVRVARRQVASVLLVLGIALAVSFGLALQFGGSIAVPTAILLGLVPAGLGLLPSYSIDVPDEQLIDVDRLSVTAWAARGGRRRSANRIRLAEVRQRVERAQQTVSAATAGCAVLAGVLGAVLLSQVGHGLPHWGAAAEVALVAIALALLPRSARSTLDKAVPRLAAAVLLLELALFVATGPPGLGPTLATAAFLAIGLIAIVSATAIGGGWLSVRLSRLADLIENVAVILALPAALIAVDAISTFRQLTSG